MRDALPPPIAGLKAVASKRSKSGKGLTAGTPGSCRNPAGVNAALALGRIKAQQVGSEATTDGETGSGISHASTHLVVVQSHIKTPMDAIV